MSFPSTSGKWVALGLGVPALAALAYVLFSLIGYKESRHDIQLANRFSLVFATRGEIEKLKPGSFTSDPLDDFIDHRGWFYPQDKLAVIYTLHSEKFTPQNVSAIPVLCEKACLGTLTDADTAPLDPDVRIVVGVVFHELIGHGSDAYAPGHLFTMMHGLWPQIVVPVPEPVQNPWKIVRRYWPLHATHPSLEERVYK